MTEKREPLCQYRHVPGVAPDRVFCSYCPETEIPCEGADDDHDNCRACYALDCPCMVTTTPLRDAVFEAWLDARGVVRTDPPKKGTTQAENWHHSHLRGRACPVCGVLTCDRGETGYCQKHWRLAKAGA